MDPQASPNATTTDKQPGCYDWLENGAAMKDLITPLDALALVLASIGHDVGHPGVNNMFMVSVTSVFFSSKQVSTLTLEWLVCRSELLLL